MKINKNTKRSRSQKIVGSNQEAKSRVGVNPDDIVRVITKRDLLDLRRYEAREGYEFNQEPSDEFLKNMPDGLLLPVIWAMVHNGVEMRCQAVADKEGNTVLVDMPVEMFFGLQQGDRTTGSVVKAIPVPSNLPKDKPRKGIDIYRVLSKAELVFLNNASDGQVQSVGELSVAQVLATIPDTGVEIRTAVFDGNRKVMCTAYSGKDSQLPSIVFTLPVDRYFALPAKVWDWPGWNDAEDGKEQDNQTVA